MTTVVQRCVLNVMRDIRWLSKQDDPQTHIGLTWNPTLRTHVCPGQAPVNHSLRPNTSVVGPQTIADRVKIEKRFSILPNVFRSSGLIFLRGPVTSPNGMTSSNELRAP